MLIQKTLIGETFIKSLSAMKLIFITPLLIRHLGVEDYGVYMYIVTSAVILGSLFSLGTTEYAKTYYNTMQDKQKSQTITTVYFVNLFLMSCFLFFFVLFDNNTLTNFLDISDTYIKMMCALAILGTFFLMILVLGQQQRQLRKVYLLQILQFILVTGLIFIIVYYQKPLYDFIYYYIYVEAIFLIACALTFSKIAFHIRFSWRYAKDMVISSLFFMFNSVVLVALTYIDKLLIKKYMDDYHLGIYTLAVSVATIPIFLLSSFFYPIVKTKLNEYIDNKKQSLLLFNTGNHIIHILFCPIILGLAVYGYYFITFYGGKDFSESYQYLPFFLVMVYINLLLYFPQQKYLLEDKKTAIRNLFVINLIATLLNILLNILTIPKYGLYGAAFSSALTYTLQFLLTLLVTKTFSVMRSLQKYSLPMILVWGGGYYIWQDYHGFWLMWVFCIVSTLVYWLLLYGLYKKEIKELYRAIKIING